MSKIKRYNINGDWYADSLIEEEHPDGEWVRWEDVEAILKMASNAVRQCIVQTGRPPEVTQDDPPPP